MRAARLITSRWGAPLLLLATLGISALVVLTAPDQPAADATDGLPAGAQSTRVVELLSRFPSGRTDSAVVVYERRAAALTPADRAALDSARAKLQPRALGGRLPPTVTSEDGRAALVVVPLAGGVSDEQEAAEVDAIRADVRPGLPGGLTAQVTGGAAFSRDISAAFDGADITLLAATAAVVAILLLITYRSPVLWIVPLLVIGVGDQVVANLLPWVARLVGERTDAAVSGIVSVLVFGAGTDYALLLISRYREELHETPDRRAALAHSLSRAAPPVLASAGTVVLALLTLLFATLTGNRTLGVSAAIGVGVAMLFGLVVLPAALACLPRGLFWPFVPRPGGARRDGAGFWAGVARLVERRPAAVLVVAALALGGLCAGLPGISIGLPDSQQFRTKVESVTAQETLARHFPAGVSQPATVIASAAKADAVAAALRERPQVVAVGKPEASDDGTLAQLSVQLASAPGGAADDAVRSIRSTLERTDATAVLGGAAAEDLDERTANLRDDAVIAPLVLAVVLVVLLLLLRSLVAPVLLVITVILSYAASLGAATIVLQDGLGLAGFSPGVPLLGFLFLVALGVDYNIFLVTRAREETVATGRTDTGMLRALTVTGGVITSAGILLAAVFAVLGVLPVVVLTEVGVLVGIGVLLDTLLVRTLVVPALSLLLGDRFWWPARPAGTPPATGGQSLDESVRFPARQ